MRFVSICARHPAVSAGQFVESYQQKRSSHFLNTIFKTQPSRFQIPGLIGSLKVQLRKFLHLTVQVCVICGVRQRIRACFRYSRSWPVVIASPHHDDPPRTDRQGKLLCSTGGDNIFFSVAGVCRCQLETLQPLSLNDLAIFWMHQGCLDSLRSLPPAILAEMSLSTGKSLPRDAGCQWAMGDSVQRKKVKLFTSLTSGNQTYGWLEIFLKWNFA